MRVRRSDLREAATSSLTRRSGIEPAEAGIEDCQATAVVPDMTVRLPSYAEAEGVLAVVEAAFEFATLVGLFILGIA